MKNGKSTVAIVVDPEYGERLLTLAKEMSVWIADTPANRLWAENFWSNSGSTGSVTTFRVNGESRENSCRNILPQVDLHHGEYSQHPAYDTVEVFGTPLTSALRETFSEYGFTMLTERPDGFRATRPSAAG